MFHVLIDQHRVVHEITRAPATGTTPGHRATLARIRAEGLTPQTLTLAAHPSGWRPGRVLSADNTTCSDPGDLHTPTLIEGRRRQVERWGRDNSGPGAVLRGQVNWFEGARSLPDTLAPRPLYIIYIGVVRSTLAAAADDGLLGNATAWAAIDRNLNVDMARFLAGATWSRWDGVGDHIWALTRFYKIGRTMLHPLQETGITAAQLAQGRAEADRVIFR